MKIRCSKCGGSGKLIVGRELGGRDIMASCRDCEGTGWNISGALEKLDEMIAALNRTTDTLKEFSGALVEVTVVLNRLAAALEEEG